MIDESNAKLDCALTTCDNPYNPFIDFTKWFVYDVTKGYNTCELLARFYNDDETLSDEEQRISNEQAIDKVLSLDYECIYKKVYRDSKLKPINEIR